MLLDKEKIDAALSEFRDVGIDESAGNDIIVSLTSFPERMDTLHYGLFSLLRQSLKPGRIILWLAREQFPNGEKDVPQAVLSLLENGLEIQWTNDIGPYKKLVPALANYPGKIIVTADDYIYYLRNWLELLYADYLKNGKKKMLYAHRVHRILFDENSHPLPYEQWEKAGNNRCPECYCNFTTCGGGTLFPPGALHEDIFNEKMFMGLAPFADDIFYWGMAVFNDTKTRIVEGCLPRIIDVNPENIYFDSTALTLFKINTLLGKNDEQFINVLNAYPDIYRKISIENRLLHRSNRSNLK